MRRLVLLCCTCLACTRTNPAFDEALANSESGSDERGETSEDPTGAEAEAEAEAEGEAESESEGGLDDLPPELTCEFQPSPGLALAFGDPSYFSNTCPNNVDVWARVTVVEGGEATLAVCAENCDSCIGEYSLSAYPLDITDYLPGDVDHCLRVQASTPLWQEPNHCYWGAISIHEAFTQVPYVVATAHSTPPTPYGMDLLAELIPEPDKALSCDCDAVGQANECCYAAPGPPEFWYYPFNGMSLFAGDYAPIELANQAGVQHYFKVFQAERIYTCENTELQLSWAVVAEL